MEFYVVVVFGVVFFFIDVVVVVGLVKWLLCWVLIVLCGESFINDGIVFVLFVVIVVVVEGVVGIGLVVLVGWFVVFYFGGIMVGLLVGGLVILLCCRIDVLLEEGVLSLLMLFVVFLFV